MEESGHLRGVERKLKGFQGLGISAKPLGLIYSCIIRTRRFLYNLRILPVRQTPVFDLGRRVGGRGRRQDAGCGLSFERFDSPWSNPGSSVKLWSGN